LSNMLYSSWPRPKREAPPVPDGTLEKNATTQAAIVKALGESVAYCDAVYAALTPTSAAETVKAGDSQIPRVQPLFGNVSHNVEHYGNLVTYFRMKKMVPPSTKREGGSQAEPPTSARRDVARVGLHERGRDRRWALPAPDRGCRVSPR